MTMLEMTETAFRGVELDGERPVWVAGRGMVSGCFAQGGDIWERPADGAATRLGEAGESLVVMPRFGERMHLYGGAALVTFIAAKSAPGDRVLVTYVTETGHAVQSSLPATACDARQHVVGVASQMTFKAACEALAQTVADERRTMEEWKHRVTERAHEEADRQGWCSEFDDFLEDIDLPRRSSDYDVFVDVTVRVCVTVNASTDDEAREAVDSDEVRRAVMENYENAAEWETDYAERH